MTTDNPVETMMGDGSEVLRDFIETADEAGFPDDAETTCNEGELRVSLLRDGYIRVWNLAVRIGPAKEGVSRATLVRDPARPRYVLWLR